ncbi:MAG: hypothetical protein HRT77_15265 [Halioglobus sp.]|nr:hypothetical protein [Halioglobus sp.]
MAKPNYGFEKRKRELDKKKKKEEKRLKKLNRGKAEDSQPDTSLENGAT